MTAREIGVDGTALRVVAVGRHTAGYHGMLEMRGDGAPWEWTCPHEHATTRAARDCARRSIRLSLERGLLPPDLAMPGLLAEALPYLQAAAPRSTGRTPNAIASDIRTVLATGAVAQDDDAAIERASVEELQLELDDCRDRLAEALQAALPRQDEQMDR